MININNIVDVDFKIIKSESIIGSYKTVAYIIPDTITIGEEDVNAVVCHNQEEVEAIESLSSEIVYNTKQFFENGGVQLILIKASNFTLAGIKNDIERARTLANDFIYVVINNTICDVSDSSTGYTSEVLVEIATYFEELRAPETLRLLLTKNIKSAESIPVYDYAYADTYKDLSVGIKFCSKTKNGKVIDAALLIGAYFTQINLNGQETIKDYCYTAEKINSETTIVNEDTGISETKFENIGSEDVTQSVYSKLVAKNYNFIDTIGNKVINFGGNLTNGVAITTDFATICVENDVCSANLSAMLGKQYLSQAGLTNLVSEINSQLQRYKDNGYIKTNTTYSGEDLYITYNGKSYKVISKGASLVQGFTVFAVPISNISVVDKNEKRFTPIYVVLETLTGARTVEIRGEVR